MLRDESLLFNTLNQLTLVLDDKHTHHVLLSEVNTPSRHYMRSLLSTKASHRKSIEQYRNLVARSNKFINVYRLSDEEVIDHVARLVHERIIQVSKVEILPHHRIPAHSAPKTAQPLQESAQTPVKTSIPSTFPTDSIAAEEEPNWIEFFLLDDESNDPFANVPIKLSMSNGRTKVLNTDSNGRIRINDLPEGLCNIEDILDECGLEVIAIQ